MDTQNQIHLYLEKLTRDFQPDTDRQVCDFLRKFSYTALKGMDAYCFQSKIPGNLQHPNLESISLTLIRPKPGSERALCVSLTRTSSKTGSTYVISAGTFNLIKTAGDPVDLSAVRMEKVLLDAVAGETPELIRWRGMYRDFKLIFQKTYSEKNGSGFIDFLKDFLPKSKRQRITAQIISDLKNLESTMLWLIENPELNGFRSWKSFNC